MKNAVFVLFLGALIACSAEEGELIVAEESVQIQGFVSVHDSCWGTFIEPVFDVQVSLWDANQNLLDSTLTYLDEEPYYSKFSFEALRPGTYRLEFKKPGFANSYEVDTFLDTSAVYKQLIMPSTVPPSAFLLDSMVQYSQDPKQFDLTYRVQTAPLNNCNQAAVVTFFSDEPTVSPERYLDVHVATVNAEGQGNGRLFGYYEAYEGNTIYALSYTQTAAEIEGRRFFDPILKRNVYFGLSGIWIKSQFLKGY